MHEGAHSCNALRVLLLIQVVAASGFVLGEGLTSIATAVLQVRERQTLPFLALSMPCRQRLMPLLVVLR